MTTQTKRNDTKPDAATILSTFLLVFLIFFSFFLCSSFMIPRSEPLPILLLVCANNRFVCLSLISFDCPLTLDDVLSPCHTIHIHIHTIPIYVSSAFCHLRFLFLFCFLLWFLCSGKADFIAILPEQSLWPLTKIRPETDQNATRSQPELKRSRGLFSA